MITRAIAVLVKRLALMHHSSIARARSGGASSLSDFSAPMLALVNSLLGNVDLINGLGRGVINIRAFRCLSDA